MWREVKVQVRKAGTFLITTHVNPDGDGIGSELALARFLRSEGKRVRILNANRTPRHYAFLDEEHAVEIFSPESPQTDAFESDVIFVLDISTVRRLGPLSAHVMSSNAVKICIDHHKSNDGFADVNVIDTGVSATGELIYDFIMATKGWLDLPLAVPLYVAIMTDTGSFRFSNTTARTHEITAHLLDIGVDPRRIYEQIYENNTAGQVKLLSNVLDTLEVSPDGRIAWVKVRRRAFEDTGSHPEDMEGMIDYFRSIEGVEVCLLFLEREGGGTKVSLRSKSDFDVNQFAARYGGGGHHHAAGMLLDRGIDEAVGHIVEEVSLLLQGGSPEEGAAVLPEGQNGASGA
jgi:phosphoesterase RecJ-like protein